MNKINTCIIRPIDRATQGIKIDLIGLTVLGGILGYNIYDINRFSSFSKYAFELTHIAAWFIFVIIVASIIFKKSKALGYSNDLNTHFSNAIGFAFALSLLVDAMYWTTIYPTATMHGPADFADTLLMHAAITVVFLTWLIVEKRSTFGSHRKSFKNKWESLLYRAVAPIGLITLLYMGWTALGQYGQKVCPFLFTHSNNVIYPGVLDWNHLGTTFITFGMAFAILSFFVLSYNYLLPKGLPKLYNFFCGPKDDSIDNNNATASTTSQGCPIKKIEY
jgi:hypothetical protein